MTHRIRYSRVPAAVALLALGGGMLPPACAGAADRGTAAASAGPLDGVWRMDGYGTVLTIDHGRLTTFQTTAVSCLPGDTAEQSGHAARDGATTYATSGADVYTVRPSDAARAVFHVAGSPGDRDLRRIKALPDACTHKAASDPATVFETFWRTYAENYPFFAAKGVDWQAVYDRYRPQVHPTTSDAQLFAILRDMVAALHDAHDYIDGGDPSRRFAQGRPGTVVPTPDFDAKVKAYIEERDLHGQPLQEFAGGRIGYADLPNGLGYLRISGFGGYSHDRRNPYAANEKLLDQALDAVFTTGRTGALKGLILDLRINGGGYDQLGLRIASRLTDHPYVAYAKRHRDDPGDPARFSRPQPITVHPAAAPRYTGPIAVLTGGSTVSAGETFTQALIDRPGRTVRIGEDTQGVFSDVMDRDLPNGWTFGLPNEEFLTRDGRTFDGTGVPPQIREPVFTDEEFTHRRDSAFDAAVGLLAGRA